MLSLPSGIVGTSVSPVLFMEKSRWILSIFASGTISRRQTLMNSSTSVEHHIFYMFQVFYQFWGSVSRTNVSPSSCLGVSKSTLDVRLGGRLSGCRRLSAGVPEPTPGRPIGPETSLQTGETRPLPALTSVRPTSDPVRVPAGSGLRPPPRSGGSVREEDDEEQDEEQTAAGGWIPADGGRRREDRQLLQRGGETCALVSQLHATYSNVV